MKPRHLILGLLALTLLLTTTAATASATTQIDGATSLQNHTFAGGQMTLVIQSEISQTVVVSDVLSGVGSSTSTVSHIDFRRVDLDPGRNVVTIEPTVYRENAVVSVSTSEAAVNVVEKGTKPLFRGAATWQHVQLAALSGLVVGFLLVAVMAWYKRAKVRTEVRRIL